MKQSGWLIAATMTIGLSTSMAAQEAAPPRDPDFREHLAKVAAPELEPVAQDPPTVAAGRAYEKMVAEHSQLVGAVRAKMAVEGRTTKGAPYSAEATSESSQTLADGNHIVRKNVTRIYRDGEGRIRREELNDNGAVESVSIVDPVAGTSIVLQPETRSAYRTDTMFVLADRVKEKTIAVGRGGGGGVAIDTPGARADGADGNGGEAGATMKRDMEQKRVARGAAGMMPPPPPPPPLPGVLAAIGGEAIDDGTTAREELGSQSVEGVAATGTRATTTIAAGAIGNEHPITVVSEQWFSPDLQVLVLTRHSDPRQGETVYRLANIVRAEPDRSLFTVPPDYTLKAPGIRER